MQVPLELSYRNLDASPAIDERVHQRVQRLEELAPDIVACRVMLEAPHRHHHQGRIYHVRVDVTVPGPRTGGQPRSRPAPRARGSVRGHP